jgi:hypothetical protein
VTGPGGTEADRAARERLTREARATASTLLDWVGTRVDGAAVGRTATRPPQSAGPCAWCPVCALVAALRGEQPELTAHLAEQASALLVVLRLLLQAHVHEHPAPAAPDPAPGEPAAAAAPEPEVPWDVAPHAHFDPDPTPAGPPPEDTPRAAAERPTGKRGPRPSPRHGSAGGGTAPATPPTPATAPKPATPPEPAAPAAPVTAPAPAPVRSTRGVQRIPVRRRPRPC